MELLVLGSGLMAKAVAFDFVRQDDVKCVYVVDINRLRLRKMRSYLKSSKLITVEAEITAEQVQELMQRCAVAVSCVPYNYNLRLTRMALRAGCNFCDLGGNNTVVRKQLALHSAAVKRGVIVIPDCGLAPGMTNILTADGIGRLDRVESVRIRVGGLPRNPMPPLFYRLVFSAQGLLNEYAEPCLVLREGKLKWVKPLTEPEVIQFPPPFNQLEAFHTSGGSSTLPESYLGRVRELDYKTIRYLGHRLMFQLIMRSAVGNWQRLPRTELGCALERVLGFEDDDVVLLRVDLSGEQDGVPRLVRYQLIDYADRGTGLTAMMRTTGFSAAIVALMLGRGEITAKGVLPGEKVVPSRRFITELRRRGFDLKIRVSRVKR